MIKLFFGTFDLVAILLIAIVKFKTEFLLSDTFRLIVNNSNYSRAKV